MRKTTEALVLSDKKAPDPFDLSAGVPPIEGELRPKPKAADRISKRVLGAVFGFVVFLVIIFLVSLDQIDNKPARVAEEKKEGKGTNSKDGKKAPDDALGDSATTLGTSGNGGKPETKAPSLVPSVSPEKMLDYVREATAFSDGSSDKKNGSSVPAIGGLVPKQGGKPGQSMIPAQAGSGASGAAVPLTPEQQAVLQAKQERATRLRQAKTTGLSAKAFDDGNGSAKPGAGGMDAIKTVLEQAAKQQGAGFAPEQRKTTLDGEQDEKLDFVKNAAKDGQGYHPYMPVAAVSKNEVKMGSYIPLTLQQGINSDLPGQVTARTSEGVYDTIDGCRLLIPPLTTAVGKYDSKIALGQSRILVVWNALIFPDGSELNLAGMQSYDTSGMSGLQSETDNHYLRIFGVGLGMSLISAAAQMAVPPPPQTTTGTSTVPSYSQSVASALAQQYGQLGGQLMGKFVAVQPTLRNYLGEQFEIMVPRTIVFNKVWANRCGRNTVGHTAVK